MTLTAPSRPRRTYETGVVTRILRVLALLGWLGVTIVVLRRYPDLPATIPTHLGLNGEPDAVGPRWSILVLLGIFWLMIATLTWLSRRSAVFTYPIEVTPENAQRVYREGERQMVGVNLTLVPVGAGVALLVLGEDAVALVWSGLALMVAVVVTGAVRAVRAGRDPDHREA
ncbi:DUF1648 domain-containing protein [Serinibacter arcticus]|uniref:DUF1648 domain-containing protein n=1 Tax=Serinibacter arcticus TaxID=1655435 RepID=UPI001092FFF4|nr:DUF1648 domain-containing protein [Serinibacter arcticus]